MHYVLTVAWPLELIQPPPLLALGFGFAIGFALALA